MSVVHDAAITRSIQDDTRFRDWIERVHDALEGVGLVQTADTGQINRATAVHPSGTNEAVGYEVFRFDDALQGDAPIFLKIEYGSGPLSAAVPAIWITAGIETDGAGEFTDPGNATTRTQLHSRGGEDFGAKGLWASGGEGYVAFLFDGSGGNPTFMFWIERFRDGAGEPTTEGFQLTRSDWSEQNTECVGNPGGVFSLGWLPPDCGHANQALLHDDAYPCTAFMGFYFRTRGVCRGVVNLDVEDTVGTVYEVTVQGEPIQYLALPVTANWDMGGGYPAQIGMRWEGDTPDKTGAVADLASYAVVSGGGEGGGGGGFYLVV